MKKFLLLSLIMGLVTEVCQAAMTPHYVTTTGTYTLAQSTNINTPTSLTTALLHPVAGDYWWIKAGVYSLGASVTVSASGTTTSPIVFEGYSVTPGDGYQGRTNQGVLVATNMPAITFSSTYLLTVSGAYVILRGLNISGGGAQTVVYTGARNTLRECVLSNSATYGTCFRTDMSYSILRCCDFYTTGLYPGKCVDFSSNNSKVIKCRIGHANSISTSVGIYTNGSSHIFEENVFLASAGIGIDMLSGTYNHIRGNTFYSQAVTCIRTANSAQTDLLYIEDNIFTDSGRALLNPYNATAAHPLFSADNRRRDNTSVDRGYGDWLALGDVTTDTGNYTTDYQGATTGDLRLVLTSPFDWGGTSVKQ